MWPMKRSARSATAGFDALGRVRGEIAAGYSMIKVGLAIIFIVVLGINRIILLMTVCSL